MVKSELEEGGSNPLVCTNQESLTFIVRDFNFSSSSTKSLQTKLTKSYIYSRNILISLLQ